MKYYIFLILIASIASYPLCQTQISSFTLAILPLLVVRMKHTTSSIGFVIYLSNIRYLLLAIMICVCMVQILLMVCQIMCITYVTTVLK